MVLHAFGFPEERATFGFAERFAVPRKRVEAGRAALGEPSREALGETERNHCAELGPSRFPVARSAWPFGRPIQPWTGFRFE